MSDTSIHLRKYILLAGDIVLLYVSLWLTLVMRFYGQYSSNTFKQHILPFSIIFLVFIMVFYINELYDLQFVKGTIGLLSKLIVSLTIGGIVASTFLYFGYNRLFTLRPQRVLLLELIIALILLYIWRVIYLKFTKWQKFSQNLLVVGQNDLAKEIIKIVKSRPQLGFQIKATIDPANQLNALEQTIKKNNINAIVSVINPRENNSLMKNLFNSLYLKVKFFEASNFYERITGKIPVNTIEHIWFLENLSETTKGTYELMKRLFDILISLTAGIISLPFIPVIAVIIKLGSRGPIFFIQTRLGKNGKHFMAIKFRSMSVGAEKNGPQWATKNDPRVTGFGKIMRKLRIDEIPQLYNILKGEMSFIGPRPERPEFVETLQKQIPFYKERLLVKPGLTGWAQVVGPSYGGSEKETLEKLQYDLYYIKNRSFGLDMSILLKTIKTVLSGSGQ